VDHRELDELHRRVGPLERDCRRTHADDADLNDLHGLMLAYARIGLGAWPAPADYAARMTARTLRYSVGNENSPADPWGRSELLIQADGSARLDHHFSRRRGSRSWTGQIDATSLGKLWTALDRAGFPELPGRGLVVPDATICTLAVDADGTERRLTVARHHAAQLPGYADALGLLDAVIRRLSQETVTYPTTQQPIVRSITPV
jgi:hypothetical protein